MPSTNRPSDQELRQLAMLLDGAASVTSEAEHHKQDLIERLDYHGITLLAARAGRLPAGLDEHAHQRRRLMVANEALKRNALCDLFEAFNEAGLTDCVLFKGSALAYSIYSEPWLRPRSDSDCLIDYSDYQAFSKLFETLGFSKLFAIEGKYVSYQSTFSKPLARDSVLNIDLHWRVNNRQTLAGSFNVDELLADGETLATLPTRVPIPCKVDSILIASLHRLGHHHSEERLVWLYDIHLLADVLTEREWEALTIKAREKKLRSITFDALRVCEELFSTHIPSNVKHSLREPGYEPSQIFLQRDLPEWRYFLKDLVSLKQASARLALIKEHVLPNADYVRRRMNTRSVVFGYGKRLLRGIKRVTKIG